MKSFIYIEPAEEGIDSITKQIASRIRKISAGLRGPLIGIGIGNHLDGRESELGGLMDELIRVEVPSEKESSTEVISKILMDIVRENGPGVLFLGFTHQGMELGPAVGWRLGIPVVTNCVEFNWIEGKTASIKRPSLHSPCDQRIKKSLPRRRRGFSKKSAHGRSGKSCNSMAIFSIEMLRIFSNECISLYKILK